MSSSLCNVDCKPKYLINVLLFRNALLSLHQKWLKMAGAQIVSGSGINMFIYYFYIILLDPI